MKTPPSNEQAPENRGEVETVRLAKVIRPLITVEYGEQLDGRREIWARHEEMPDLDVLLATLHYSYAYLDNARIGDVAEKIAQRLISLCLGAPNA